MEVETINQYIPQDPVFASMDGSSRVWIYQADRSLSGEESIWLQKQLDHFAKDWTSHNHLLRAGGYLIEGIFVLLVVDESNAPASGCSIDSSVHFIQRVGEHLKIDFMNRMNFAFLENDSIRILPRTQFKEAYQQELIDDSTLVFDHLVNTKQKLLNDWIKPLSLSWHKRMV